MMARAAKNSKGRDGRPHHYTATHLLYQWHLPVNGTNPQHSNNDSLAKDRDGRPQHYAAIHPFLPGHLPATGNKHSRMSVNFRICIVEPCRESGIYTSNDGDLVSDTSVDLHRQIHDDYEMEAEGKEINTAWFRGESSDRDSTSRSVFDFRLAGAQPLLLFQNSQTGYPSLRRARGIAQCPLAEMASFYP